ncbi:hypothetical protein EQG64_19890 [Streptomyces sp. S6]|nr:hypothetical protein EQG64_19890 [Streptomyces sp. S6]
MPRARLCQTRAHRARRDPGREPRSAPRPAPARRRPAQRLFAAVLPPPSAVAELRTAVAPLHALPGAQDLRWTRPEDWHVTLAFYGDVRERRTAGAGGAAGAGRGPSPSASASSGAGHFGGAGAVGRGGGLDAAAAGRARGRGGRRSGVPLAEHRRSASSS